MLSLLLGVGTSLCHLGFLSSPYLGPSRRDQMVMKPTRSTLRPLEAEADWHYEWKPEPRPPATPEEHAAAAKKYGLLPQDYKPITREGISTDYPEVPLVSPEARDPYYNWDNPEYKRDFGEPMHDQWDLYSEDRVNANLKLRYSPSKMLAAFLGAIGGYTLIFLYFNDKKMFRPVMPKQYARDGVHYSFELKE